MLRVFLDCNRCDDEYMRQNVGFVDYVRDRAVADYHVLVTTQDTGGGGLSWVVKFIGVDRLAGHDRTLSFTTGNNATQDEQRKEFARVFKLGLASEAADTNVASQLDVTWKKPEATAGAQALQPKKDPWNYWLFRVGTSGSRNGEQSSHSSSFSGNFSANRTTNEWKIQINGNMRESSDSFDIDEETTIDSKTESWNMNGSIIKSLTPKWSFGVRGNANHSSFSNTDRSYAMSAGIEYNFFPYSESARRSLTVQYTAGPTYFKYAELTVYDKLSETVPRHFLNVNLNMRQPWGSLSVSSSFSQQLNSLDFYRLGLFGEADIRLFKGFSIFAFGGYDKIADQLSLRKGAASETEILLRLHQLSTGFSYFYNFGISYSFGSIFNSVVNTRFDGG